MEAIAALLAPRAPQICMYFTVLGDLPSKTYCQSHMLIHDRLCVQVMMLVCVHGSRPWAICVFNAVARQNLQLHCCTNFTLVAELNSVHIAPIPPCTRVDRADLLTVHSRRGVAPGGSDFKLTPADFVSAQLTQPFTQYRVRSVLPRAD